jgi:hypothetical protein
MQAKLCEESVGSEARTPARRLGQTAEGCSVLTQGRSEGWTP